MFQELLAKCFQYGHRAQDNGGGRNSRPEGKPTASWEHAVGKRSCVSVQNIVTTVETQPFDSVPSWIHPHQADSHHPPEGDVDESQYYECQERDRDHSAAPQRLTTVNIIVRIEANCCMQAIAPH